MPTLFEFFDVHPTRIAWQYGYDKRTVMMAYVPQASIIALDQNRSTRRQGRTQSDWTMETKARSFRRSLMWVSPLSMRMCVMLYGIMRRFVANCLD